MCQWKMMRYSISDTLAPTCDRRKRRGAQSLDPKVRFGVPDKLRPPQFRLVFEEVDTDVPILLINPKCIFILK